MKNIKINEKKNLNKNKIKQATDKTVPYVNNKPIYNNYISLVYSRFREWRRQESPAHGGPSNVRELQQHTDLG